MLLTAQNVITAVAIERDTPPDKGNAMKMPLFNEGGDSSADCGGRNLRNFAVENVCLRLEKLGAILSHRRVWRGSGGEDGLLSVGEKVRRHLQTTTLLAVLLCYLSNYL